MTPNFFDSAHTEQTQDGFIAWLCSCYGGKTRNKALKSISKKFIKTLLGISINNLSRVEAEIQKNKIDIFLTLNSGKYYVIIEDKKNSQIPDDQLRRYIDDIKENEGISENRIFVVYYKTGHLSSTPNCIYCKNSGCYYDSTKKSEKEQVEYIKQKYPKLAGLKICTLKDIYDFFQSKPIEPLVGESGSEILQDYVKNIEKQYKNYTKTKVNAKDGRKEPIWGRIFDDFITKIKTKYPELLFKLDYYSGKYWEIYITENPKETGNGSQPYNAPILNIRSNIFEEKTHSIYFFNVNNNKRYSSLERHQKSSSYVINWGKFNRKGLNRCRFSGKTVSIKNIHRLLDAICKEFNNYEIKKKGEGFKL